MVYHGAKERKSQEEWYDHGAESEGLMAKITFCALVLLLSSSTRDMPAQGQQPCLDNGRYQLSVVPASEDRQREVYRIDTRTGKTWTIAMRVGQEKAGWWTWIEVDEPGK
jgi:hypothetical protein